MIPRITWPEHPSILEINAWTWLHELSQRYGKSITLQTIPEEAFDGLIDAFDVVWLMGVWCRSPRAREIARNRPELQDRYQQALPDFTPDDVVGSPYAVYSYRVESQLGALKGLKRIRNALLKRGKLLILDFVPNHVAPDHPWVKQHPEFFLQGTHYDLNTHSQDFLRKGDTIFAHGKDPYFPAWPDTLQVNAFSEDYRRQVITTLQEISAYCDGVRCDMAMLMVDHIFRQTWGERGGHPLGHQFWYDVINPVKQVSPNFKFLAEVYWDMGWELQQQGFDYCYDKCLYERLLYDHVGSIKGHLHAEWDYQSRLVRFVENHDEPRAIATFGQQRSLAAAAIALTLPGARLLHYGQHLGRQVKLPVELGRVPHETVNPEVQGFYQRFLKSISTHMDNHGQWRLFHIDGMDYWQSPFISYVWENERTMFLVVVNYGEHLQTGYINLDQLGRPIQSMTEEMQGQTVMFDPGQPSIEISARPWEVKLFHIDIASQ
jgi:hypothetical protein